MNKLGVDPGTLAQVCRRHHIRKLSLLGSMLEGTDRPDSDVDLLVEFVPGQEPGFLGLAEAEMKLSALLSGRRVDLRTLRGLSRSPLPDRESSLRKEKRGPDHKSGLQYVAHHLPQCHLRYGTHRPRHPSRRCHRHRRGELSTTRSRRGGEESAQGEGKQASQALVQKSTFSNDRQHSWQGRSRT